MKDRKEKRPKPLEQQLAVRLKAIGFLVTGFALIAFGWGLFLPPSSPVDTPEEMALSSGFSLFSSDGRLDLFGIAGIFALVGALCLVIANRRKRA